MNYKGVHNCIDILISAYIEYTFHTVSFPHVFSGNPVVFSLWMPD